ncbi:MAG: hypothetical protein INQ03_06445 [Candidatus Heimdallarchaeota archaeon]|nr:hypothetical protein [Candidatus Heimdallarchaeota archaeon]
MSTFNNIPVQLAIMQPESKIYYQLILVLGSLTPLKIRILLLLSHLSPTRVSATQLTALLGYSKKSRIIYRGVLEELEEEQFIDIERISKKKFSIQINLNHPLMKELVELCFDFGETYTDNLLDMMEMI